MTVFVMFFVELMASRYEFLGTYGRDLEVSDPAMDLVRKSALVEEKSDGYRDSKCDELRFLRLCFLFLTTARSASVSL